ncbi:MAG: hypothetical protein IAF94_20035 [Pirellulaceae bacterium]|nr:hypothetical protein [Pirellulaceae bacterium]
MSQPEPAINPYASPQISGGYAPGLESAAGFPGLWRQGNLLVMHKQAPLPPICLKSGEPATQRLKRKLQWHEPWLALTVLIAIPVYVIIALIMTKRATLMIGLTDEWAARRKTRIMIALGIMFFGIGLAVLGIFLGSQGQGSEGWFGLLPGALVVLVLAALYGQYACRLVWPKRITDQYVWLQGVHPSFLDRLPVWPYGVI